MHITRLLFFLPNMFKKGWYIVVYFWKEGVLMLEERTISSHERVMYIKQVHGKFIETDGVKRENELDVLWIRCKKNCTDFPLSLS